ncbi:TVP38/TMEM64 family protein [Pseudoneobacillus sp. C159]
MKKTIPILLTAFILYLGITFKAELLSAVRSEAYIAIPISMLFVAILVFFPVIPYVVLAGMIGSVFGIWLGTGISFIGIGVGIMVMFLLARFGFQEWMQGYLQKYPKLQDYEGMFENNAFLGILIARAIPVIPSPIVNIVSGVSKVKWQVFLGASLLGKLPAIFIFTIAGSLIGNQKWISIVIYATYFLSIAILIGRRMKQNQLADQQIVQP